MQHFNVLLVVAGISCVAGVNIANAIPCYMVLDRTDAVIYRGVPPPVDLSQAGSSARNALRERGYHLLSIDSDQCPEVGVGVGPSGTSVASVEQIVAGYRSFMVNKGGYNPSASGVVRATGASSAPGVPNFPGPPGRPPTASIPGAMPAATPAR